MEVSARVTRRVTCPPGRNAATADGPYADQRASRLHPKACAYRGKRAVPVPAQCPLLYEAGPEDALQAYQAVLAANSFAISMKRRSGSERCALLGK